MKFIFLLFAFLQGSFVFADSTDVIVREFNAEKLRAYKNNDAYRYDREQFDTKSKLQELMDSIEKYISRLMDLDLDKAGNLQDFILVVIVLIALGLIVFLIVKGNFSGLFSGRGVRAKLDEYSIMDENIHEINFESQLAEAIALKEYRKAIRLYYLQSLKQLSDAGLIDWKPNKTNREYRREIKDAGLRLEFDEITLNFEYTWYGNFIPDEESFQKMVLGFKRFGSHFKTQTA